MATFARTASLRQSVQDMQQMRVYAREISASSYRTPFSASVASAKTWETIPRCSDERRKGISREHWGFVRALVAHRF